MVAIFLKVISWIFLTNDAISAREILKSATVDSEFDKPFKKLQFILGQNCEHFWELSE